MEQVMSPIEVPQKEGAIPGSPPPTPPPPPALSPPSPVPVPAPEQPQPTSKTSSTRPLFAYTQGTYWGGATLNYTMYRLLAVFGGLLALDHWYLRSPTTAFAKIILNVVTFGFWYFYDVFQALGERDDVERFGISLPWFGPAGIGAGGFVSDTNPSANNASPFWFILYALGLFILPFGLDYVVAGDYVGAGIKAISTLFVFGLLYTVINIYKLLAHPEKVLCEGTSRYFPWSLVPGVNAQFQDAFFANTNRTACPAEPMSESSLLGLFSGILRGLRGIPVVGAVAEAVSTVTNAARVVTEVPTRVTAGLQAASNELAEAPVRAQSATLNESPAQVGGGNQAEQGHFFVGFTLALLFIGAIFYRGRDIVAKVVERGIARPPAVGTILWRKENVGDVPPAPPQSGIF